MTAITAASATQRLLTIADKADALETTSGYSIALMDVAKLNGLIVRRSESIKKDAFELKSAKDQETLTKALENELARRR